ncbi:MAG: ABC transporter substrate-binding protein [Pseudomonadota bacterium]|nr:ABC transporter substrate-binding protein [Pseudomonadota bacterium]
MGRILTTLAVSAAALAAPHFARAESHGGAPMCGANTGEAASGEPIKVGGIFGNAAPGDFSSATDSAKAYFDCVNANGGIGGRPIEYLTENDQWNPELAAQAATKLIEDENVVAMVGNGSFVEMSVNAPRYAEAGMMAMASACAVSECFESSNIVSTNQGPLPSSVGAAMYAVEELGATNVACIGLAIPSVGNWSCGAVEEYMGSKGLSGSSVLLNPAAPDVNSGLLEAISNGADSILVNLPAGLGIAFLGVAQEQDLGEAYSWTSSTPLYDLSVPGALGEYWDGKLYVSAELTKLDGEGADNLNWKAVMDGYAAEDDPRDTFSQSGYLSAKFFVETLMEMDPATLDDRAAVTEAIKGITGKTSDLICGTYYVGDADRHMPNHAGIMVVVKDGGFEQVRDCFEYEGPYFEPLIETEKALGLR